MKKFIFSVFFVLLLVFGFGTKAEEVNNNVKSDEKLIAAGITPQSPFYSIDRFFENLSLRLTFSEKNKIKKLSKYGEERLSEINSINLDSKNPEKSQEWLDKLFDDYGVNLSKANDLLCKLIAQKKTKQTEVEKLQNIIEDITSKEELIKQDAKEKINKEIQNKVKEIKIQTYLTAISGSISDENLKKFKEKKYGNSVIVKLNALSELSGLSIDEIMELDIYYSDDPTTTQVEKEIDFSKLETALGLDKDEIINQLKEYHKALNEKRQAEKDKDQSNGNNGNNGKGPENGKQEEANDKQEQIKKGFSDRFKGSTKN